MMGEMGLVDGGVCFRHAGLVDGDKRPISSRLTVGISSFNRSLRALKFCGDVERRREPLVREVNHGGDASDIMVKGLIGLKNGVRVMWEKACWVIPLPLVAWP